MPQISSTRLTLTLSLCLAGILTGCATVDMPKGKSEGYTSARFVKPSDSAMEGSGGSAELNRVIQEAIGSEFEHRGITMGTPDAELVIAYMLIIQDNVSTSRIDDYYGYVNEGGAIQDMAHTKGVLKNKRRDAFERGAIVIDVVDAKRNKLIYRDYAVRDILEGIADDLRQERIHQAVQEALAPFFR